MLEPHRQMHIPLRQTTHERCKNLLCFLWDYHLCHTLPHSQSSPAPASVCSASVIVVAFSSTSLSSLFCRRCRPMRPRPLTAAERNLDLCLRRWRRKPALYVRALYANIYVHTYIYVCNTSPYMSVMLLLLHRASVMERERPRCLNLRTRTPFTINYRINDQRGQTCEGALQNTAADETCVCGVICSQLTQFTREFTKCSLVNIDAYAMHSIANASV